MRLTFVPISSLKRSSCCWPMTRVLPNHRRSGCIRVLGSSFDWRSWTCYAVQSLLRLDWDTITTGLQEHLVDDLSLLVPLCSVAVHLEASDLSTR